MYTVTMNEFRTKQDEMFRQAEKYRLIQAVQKQGSQTARILRTLRIAISSLFTS